MKYIKIYEDFHNQMNEFFYFPANHDGLKIIAIENFENIDPEVSKAIDELIKGGSTKLIDCTEMSPEEIRTTYADNAENNISTIFINMDKCDPKVNDAVMDLYPDIIPAEEVKSLRDLF